MIEFWGILVLFANFIINASYINNSSILVVSSTILPTTFFANCTAKRFLVAISTMVSSNWAFIWSWALGHTIG